ncbi:phytoene/squalene synthase family protein [Crateriforma conspicua]|uniref:All-trans-phytoene synthase n=1 Tax=Crateriforma conspicua TaxID=2527996 RepID=A0A5C6FQR8_9PLAN|nr:phytoene/squalene synthase family protein [Crateriforma conspicua]TWU65229.1 All-trans-phytoene synthase [Crateriforma conspicua]
MTVDSIEASYRCAKQIARRSGSNFYRSFWLLPAAKRKAMHALYAFARITDDVGDSHEPVALRSRALTWWRQTVALNLIGEDTLVTPKMPKSPTGDVDPIPSGLPDVAVQILPALRDAAQRFEVPSRYLLEIVDGVMADQQKTRFDTFEQLEHYCYLVASAVGLACLHIWQFESPLPVRPAVDCGLAFQLTNILRDVKEDASRGRIYLPRQHYEQHGLSEDDLLSPRRDDRFQCLIRDEICRAERLFDSSWELWDSIHDDGKPMFSMMWRTYRRLLQQIAEDPGAVAERRVRLSRRDRWSLALGHLVRPWYRRLPIPPAELQMRSEPSIKA